MDSVDVRRMSSVRRSAARRTLNAAPSSVQNIVLGAIILLAVGIDMWRAEISVLMGRLFGRSSARKTSNIKKEA